MSKDESDFSHSLADLMTSLAIVFLILAVAMVIYAKLTENRRAALYTALVGEHDKAMTLKKEILDQIIKTFDLKALANNSLSTDNECMSIDGDSSPYKITIRFKSTDERSTEKKQADCKSKGFFYKSDDYQSIKEPRNAATISKIVTMFESLCEDKDKNNIDHVQILGHTDKNTSSLDRKNCDPYSSETSQEKSLQCENIFLSAQRARDVFMRVGVEILKKNNDSLLSCFKSTTEVSGRGPFNPVSKVDSENRRVEIVINFKQPRITP